MAYRFILPRADVGDGIPDFDGAKLSFFDFGTSTPKETFSDFALTMPNADPVVADADGIFGDIFLDIQASMSLFTANDVLVYGPTNIFAPEDGITTLAAADVSVADTGGNFTATDVEGVLTELSDNWLRLDRINTISAIQTFTVALQMSDQELRRPLILDYAIKSNTVSSSGGTLTLDMSTGNSFETTLTEDTTIVITNPPGSDYGQLTLKATQDGAGGAFTITWPAGVKWPSGVAPVMSVANNAIDEFTLRTTDAGTEYRGGFSQAFA